MFEHVVTCVNVFSHLWQVPSDFDTDSVRVTLLGQLSTFLSPLGTKENPAMSCQDIYTCNDNFKPGETHVAQACGNTENCSWIGYIQYSHVVKT